MKTFEINYFSYMNAVIFSEIQQLKRQLIPNEEGIEIK